MKKIYTVGYEGKTQDDLLKLISEKGIRHLVDVRTSTGSQRSEFCGDALKKFLFNKGILYKHIKELGGLNVEDYTERMQTEGWRQAFLDLLEFASEAPTVIMCMEKEPSKCHRRFISQKLEEMGWDVIHLDRGGSWKGSTLDDFTETQEKRSRST
ncbi:MAG: DUF488 domain-containing protein [Thermoplasmata archaeon]